MKIIGGYLLSRYANLFKRTAVPVLMHVFGQC